MATRRARATAPGYYDTKGDGHPREIHIGQEFDLPETTKQGRWWVWVAAPVAKPADPPKGGGKG